MAKKSIRVRCDQCTILHINGVKCHESGCPVSWRDYDQPCGECGTDFRPATKHQSICDGCNYDLTTDELDDLVREDEVDSLSDINYREFSDRAENGSDYDDLESASEFMSRLEADQSEAVEGRCWPR